MQSIPHRLASDGDGDGFTAPWYAVYTRHQHEKRVARNLSNKGFETFLPLFSAARRWKDRTKELMSPLFPCYVFLRSEFGRWLDILTTPGIHSLVGIPGQPAPIRQAEIDVIRRAIEKGIGMEPHPFLRCGDWVRVKSGPLEGVEGILVRKKNRFRLVLSVELLEKSVAVEVDSFAVERVVERKSRAASKWSAGALPARFEI